MGRAVWAAAPAVAVLTLLGGTGTGSAATVFTLEGGFVGMQHIWRSTPNQLQGKPCQQNTCTPIDYFALPVGSETIRGGQMATEAIAATPADEKTILLGHSQGGQVIYSALRDWKSGAQTAPPVDKVTWISLGNPENKYGRQAGGIGYTNGQGVPLDTPYRGYEVIRQYDGWADWPDDTSNLLAVANATVGMFTVHNDYKSVNPDGNFAAYAATSHTEGQITYVWVPTDTLPLIAWTGPFAPALDNALRPIVERAYHRPVNIPDPTPPAGADPDETTLTTARFSVDQLGESAPATARKTELKATLAKSKPALARSERAAERADKRKAAVRDTVAKIKNTVTKLTQRPERTGAIPGPHSQD